MNHLESLIAEFLEWQGYLLCRNRNVGKRPGGGYEGELEPVGYHPVEKRLVHYEPGLDAASWAKREGKYKKKFAVGRKYILKDIFPWLSNDTLIEQYAILFDHPKGHDQIAEGKIYSVDEYVKLIREKVWKQGRVGKNAIPERYPLLRTIQMVDRGYRKPIPISTFRTRRD